MTTLNKNTIKCDRCEKDLDPDKDKAYCFHGEEDGDETYICGPCVAEVYNEYIKDINEGQN